MFWNPVQFFPLLYACLRSYSSVCEILLWNLRTVVGGWGHNHLVPSSHLNYIHCHFPFCFDSFMFFCVTISISLHCCYLRTSLLNLQREQVIAWSHPCLNSSPEGVIQTLALERTLHIFCGYQGRMQHEGGHSGSWSLQQHAIKSYKLRY